MSILIHARNISLTYPAPHSGLRGLFRPAKDMPKALDSISFSLSKGERLALVGLNGSGKSTLLRTLAGIYTPDEGEVKVNGNVVGLFNLGIGMRTDMSGRANIILQGMMTGRSKNEMLDLMPNIIEFSELESVIDDPVHTYSQGMAMRLNFAVATELAPEILLLDEWIGAGDRVFREKANNRLVAMVEKTSGLVLASHNVAILKRYCTKAIYLKTGYIESIGEINSVLDKFTEDTRHTHT